MEKKYIPSIVSRADINLAHNDPSPLFRFGISFNKLFDYLAAGKPVLCDFPCPSNPAIQCGAGISVAAPSSGKIAAAVESMSALPQETYQQYCSAARAAAEKYDFRVLTQKLLSVTNTRERPVRRSEPELQYHRIAYGLGLILKRKREEYAIY